MAHYAADNAGHPLAVNRSVPLIYPKDRGKFGNSVTYAEDPKRHVMVEFAFDVVQVAAGAYLPDAYRSFIGFEVSKPLLERAFRETYGLEVKDVFFDTDLAIGTFRWAVSKTIPEMTVVAWRDKEDEIRKVTPSVQRNAFVYTLTRQEYEREFGTMYRKPGIMARFFVAVMKVIPKFGPFGPLAFKAPTPEAERLFAESFRTARDRYRGHLRDAADGRIDLANTDFDTGRRSAWREYHAGRQDLHRVPRPDGKASVQGHAGGGAPRRAAVLCEPAARYPRSAARHPAPPSGSSWPPCGSSRTN